MNRLFARIILISVVLFFFSPLNGMGAEKFNPDKIAHTLAPLEAAVIKSQDGRYLLNMGTDNHIKKGDLWTLYTSGEQIIDPGTGKKLGALPVILAVCNVIRVDKSFSEITIKCLKEPCDIQSGLTTHRFRDIKTTFQDVTGSSFHLYELIRARLPELDWQAYQSIENTPRPIPPPDEIIIVADKKSLTIWSGGEIAAAYEKSPSIIPDSRAATSLSELPVTEKKKNIPGLSNNIPGLSTTLEIKNISTVTGIDHPVISMGIMTPIDSTTPYFIYLYNRTVDARAMDGTKKFQYDYKGFGDVINMSMGPNGRIALNTYVQSEGMRSRVLQFSSSGFAVLTKDISHFLEFSGTGKKEMARSLIGQDFDAESYFGPVAFHLDADSDGTIKRHDTIKIPAGFRLPGAFFADLNGNGTPETAFYNAGGKLVVYEANKEKWESGAPFGPSNAILIEDMIDETNAPTDLRLWPQPVLFQFDNLVFAVIPANDSEFWRTVSGNSQNGGLGILCPHNGTYTFRLLNTRFQGPVQSVCLYDQLLYIAVVEGNTYTGKGITHVLSLPIADLKERLK